MQMMMMMGQSREGGDEREGGGRREGGVPV